MLTWPAPQRPVLPGRGEVIRITDTASGAHVVAAEGPTAALYVCGITPYDATHIGHANTFVAFDVLVRAWLDAGLDVAYALNVTDVDDPLLERATATGVDWRDLATSQIDLFGEDMTALGVIPPTYYRGVVESVDAIAADVARLLESGVAYRVPLEPGSGGTEPGLGDVYADLSTDADFGSVSGLDARTMHALFAERGGDPDRPGKRGALDPLLWRRERAGEPAWDGGVLGTGRPGWHIECTSIASRTVGLPFDVQGGGSDLVFPHHEMSASHAAALGLGGAEGHHRGAHAFVHAGMVGLEGEKMSKSKGNLVLVSVLRAEGVEPAAIRLALLAHHYAADWDWDDAVLAEAQARHALWLDGVSGNGGPDATGLLAELRSALADDLDTPRALAAVDEWATRSVAGANMGWDTTDPAVHGAPGLVARAVNALLGVRL